MKSEQTTAIYCRVSTTGQKIDSQKKDLVKFSKGRGWTKQKIYLEHKSGVSDSRTSFDKMIADAKSGKLKRVVIWDLSRLSRKGVADTIQTIDFLQKLGVKVYSKRENLSFDNQMGLVMASLFSAMANIDYEMRREKQALGIQAVRDRNNGKCPWGGVRRTKDRSKDESIFKLRKGGQTIRGIAKDLSLSVAKVQGVINEYIEKGLLNKGRQEKVK